MTKRAILVLVLGILLFPALAHASGGPGLFVAAFASRGHALGVTRTPMDNGLAEYSAVLKVGPSPHDRIRIHRVVKEDAPWIAHPSDRAIVLVHGSSSNFRTAWAQGLEEPGLFPLNSGMAPFLAEQGFDVWGISERWSFVPLETTDFSFMQDWSLASTAEDVRVVANIARTVRAITGHGHSKLFFSGHSIGADIIYTYANDETQLPPWQKTIRGLIPLDMVTKLSPGPESQLYRDNADIRCAVFKAQYDAGQYALLLGAQVSQLFQAAIAAPNAPSPLLPGLTNQQVGTTIYAQTFLFYAPLPPYTPWYHYLAGTFDQNGIASGFQFADRDQMFAHYLNFPSYQPIYEGIEVDAFQSGCVDIPNDDHFAQITAPVFYVGVAGGFGELGLQTFPFLGSTDKTSHIVRLQPSGGELFDYGHADLILADNASTLVWQPMADWMSTH